MPARSPAAVVCSSGENTRDATSAAWIESVGALADQPDGQESPEVAVAQGVTRTPQAGIGGTHRCNLRVVLRERRRCSRYRGCATHAAEGFIAGAVIAAVGATSFGVPAAAIGRSPHAPGAPAVQRGTSTPNVTHVDVVDFRFETSDVPDRPRAIPSSSTSWASDPSHGDRQHRHGSLRLGFGRAGRTELLVHVRGGGDVSDSSARRTSR